MKSVKFKHSRSNGVRIGRYRSIKAFTNRLKYILHTHTEGEPLEGQELEDVIMCLEFHPKVYEKVGEGVQYITTQKGGVDCEHVQWAPHFHIYRTDGSNIDFSYKVCLNNIKNGSNSLEGLW